MVDERLAAILGACVEARMRGRAPDVEALCRAHPDLAASLREHLALLELMDRAFAGGGEAPGEPSRRIGGNDPRNEEAGMGWGRMFFLGNIGQQLDIEEQREEMRKLRRELRRSRRGDGGEAAVALEERVGRIERENDELRLYLAALIRHLGRRGGLDPTALARVVSEIDAEDGAADGRYEGPISG